MFDGGFEMMIDGWLESRKIWLHQEAVDFRKQLDGLSLLVSSELEMDASDGTIYIFRNRSKDKIKLLVWERNGFFLGYKRLERGRFSFPVNESGQVEISKAELGMLISGMPMTWLGGESRKKVSHF